MADEATLLHSMEQQETVFDFDSRQYAYVADTNNSSYANGQVVFDCGG